MTYYNKVTKDYYYGGSMTRRLDNGTLFSGVPSKEQLNEWGYEEYVENTVEYQPTQEELRQQRMAEIQSLLQQTDYIVLKKAEGIDISNYDERYQPTFLEWRQALRDEYNELEQQNT